MSVVLSEHLPLLASAPSGIQKLRGLILELAVRGKLVPQDASDEPASELLKRIAKERARLEAEGVCKRMKATPVVGKDEQPFEVPVGWSWVRIDDISQLVTDGEHATPTRTSDRNSIPLVTAKNVRDGYLDYTHTDFVPKDVAEKCWKRCKPTIGDILLVSVGATLGRLSVLGRNQDMVLVRSVTVIRPCLVGSHYFATALRSTTVQGSIWRGVKQSAQPCLYLSQSSSLPIPLPPLAEQHRIVAKVDELMALCDQLEAEQTDAGVAHARLVDTLLGTLSQSTDAADLAANWQRLAEHFDALFTTEASIDALKQTVLQLAVMGKLVPQDPHDEPASDLLKRIAKERESLVATGICKKFKATPIVSEGEQQFAIPLSWSWVRLSDVVNKITDGTHHSPPNLPSGDFKYISAKNIKSWGIDLSGMTYVTKAIHEEIFARCNPEFGDVLYIKDGATTGVVTINTLTEPFSMLSSVALLKPSIGLFNRYLYFLMSSPVFYSEMRAGMTGVAITRVTLAKLNSALLPLPPFAEQHRIVAKVDELMALCDSLKTDLATARQRQATLAETLIEKALEAT